MRSLIQSLFQILSLITSLFFLTELASARPKTPEPSAGKAANISSAPPVAGPCYGGICEFTLSNGLKVLLYPDQAKSRVLVNITYLVGSKHENYGETGMAHLLEHLLFKGTPSIPDLDKEADKRGFAWNGTTWLDRTNYYEVFDNNPEYLDFALKLEADRMVNSFIAKKDLDSEMTVVRNEMERGETDPFRVSIKVLNSLAYLWHNYGKSTIGARSDVENVPIERLQAFYRQWYQPDNAWLLVAGPIDQEKTLALVVKHFGGIKKPTRTLPAFYTEEPAQDGERFAVVRRPGTNKLIMAGYHVPALAHEHSAHMSVLASVLGDSTTGRLRESLVANQLAAGVGEFGFELRERGLQLFFASLASSQDEQKAAKAMTDAIETLASKPITEAEFKRAQTKLRNDFSQVLDDVSGLGIGLSEYIASGDWRLFFWRQQQLDRMTLDQVNQAARYLLASNRSLVQFLPSSAKSPKTVEIPRASAAVDLIATLKPDTGSAQVASFDVSPGHVDSELQRITIRPGLTLALLSKPSKNQAVQITLAGRYGNLDTLKQQSTVASLVGSMLARGTQKRDRVAFDDAIQQLESDVSMQGGATGYNVSARSTRKHVQPLIELIAEALKTPKFAAEEFEQAKVQRISDIERAMDDPNAMAFQTMALATQSYPDGHPRQTLDYTEQQKQVRAATIAQLQAFHSAHYGAQALNIVAVGDFDAEQLSAAIRTHFENWNPQLPFQEIESELARNGQFGLVAKLPGKANATLAMSLPLAISERHPDYPALVMGTFAFGGGGMSGRLMERVRQKEGWSYGAGAFIDLDPRLDVGSFGLFAISAPENARKVEKAAIEEMKRVGRDFSDEELLRLKEGWIKDRRVGWSNDATLARLIAAQLVDGKDMQSEVALEAAIEKLDAATVRSALVRWIKPELLNSAIAGDDKKIAPLE